MTVTDEFFTKLSASVCFGASSPSYILGCVSSTIQTMISDRGYSIVHCSDYAACLHDEEAALLRGVREEEPSEIVCHLLTEGNKLGVKQLRLMETKYDLQRTALILVTIDGQTSFCKNLTAENIHVFTYTELLVNPTQHDFVPLHSLVTADGVRELEDTYGPVRHFPKILQSDPIVRYYGWKRGDILRIDRRCCMAQRMPFYREVI